WDEIRKIEEIAVKSVHGIFEKSLSNQNFVHEFLYKWWKGNVVEVYDRIWKTRCEQVKKWESEQNIGLGTINFEHKRLQDLVPRSERTKAPTEFLYKHEVPALFSYLRSCIVIAIALLAMATEPTVLINKQTH
ncbi:458_t:CDS:2, partial [Gigaspora margarita]